MKIQGLLWAILACLLAAAAPAQQIDTAQLKKQIDNLADAPQIQRYLDRLLEEDQKFRGAMENDSLDARHLLSISYFVNKFGYPSSKIYGRGASAPWVIWVHNDRRLRILSFPIILKGFLAGQFKEKDLRDYYLRTIYTYRFDDEGHLTLPLKELFAKLELNTTERVPIDRLYLRLQEKRAFEQAPRTLIGKWKTDGKSKTYDLKGKDVTVNFEGETAIIFTLPDGRLFFQHYSSAGKFEVAPVQQAAANKYVFSERQTDKYLWIEGSSLILKNDQESFAQYTKVEKAP